jgi:hypothetical protein
MSGFAVKRRARPALFTDTITGGRKEGRKWGQTLAVKLPLGVKINLIAAGWVSDKWSPSRAWGDISVPKQELGNENIKDRF